MHKKVALIILDGWGIRDEIKDNAIAEAKTPFFDELWSNNPHTLLEASGEAVGLPDGQMGNSEVGHTTIGAGTILDTDLVRISKAARDGDFNTIPAMHDAFAHAVKNNSTLHLIGLIGDGGVHSHSSHLYALLRSAKKAGVTSVSIHGFTDGRDTPPQSASTFVRELEAIVDEVGNAFIASLSGRYFGMDRDNNWDRQKGVEEIIFEGKGYPEEMKVSDYLKEQYKYNVMDERLNPVSFKLMPISEHDSVIFFNYRPDRAKMLSSKIAAFAETNDVYFCTMTEYDSTIKTHIAFGQKTIETTLAKELSLANKTQVHIAETEKYAHATTFLNGGVEGTYDGETHILVPSRKDVVTHDEAPEMKAVEIANETIKYIESGVDFIFVNFANPDMIGHTGNVPAIVKAVEIVDRELKRVVDVASRNGYVTIITADHGNAELNKDQNTGIVHTAHTISQVPCIITGIDSIKLKNGGLSNIAPTVLDLMGVKKPEVMTGESLIQG